MDYAWNTNPPASGTRTACCSGFCVPFAVLMFGFAFAQVPLFGMFCKAIGINLSPLNTVTEGGTGREVKILFTGVAADKLPVVFKPKRAIQTVEVGTRFENEYRFVNMSTIPSSSAPCTRFYPKQPRRSSR